MKILLSFTLCLAICGVVPSARCAAGETNTAAVLQNRLDLAVKKTFAEFAAKNLQTNQLAVTLIDLTRPAAPVQASFRGDAAIYPASVIKLFYLVATHRWIEDGKLQDTAELRRAMRDMIVESYNEATHYVLDLLTDTTSGPELPAPELDQWVYKRNTVNRYFVSVGYTHINANKKPWCEGPYGREIQASKAYQPSRNSLTTDSTARLLAEIVRGKSISKARSDEMMKLLERDPFGISADPDDQAHGFSGSAVPPGGKLWSKAGWTSETRHDAAYIELPNGGRFVAVVFTVGHSNDREIIPFMVRGLMEALR